MTLNKRKKFNTKRLEKTIKNKNTYYKHSDNNIKIFLFFLYPLVTAAKQITSPTGNKRRNTGQQMLCRKMYSSEAWLKNKAHIQYEYQQKINCISHLLIEKHYNKVFSRKLYAVCASLLFSVIGYRVLHISAQKNIF